MTALDALPRGRHRQTRKHLHRRILARFRTARQRRQAEDRSGEARARFFRALREPAERETNPVRDAMVYLAQHPEQPAPAIELIPRKQPEVTDGFNVAPAAVLPDEDVPGLDHLAGGQYGDDTLAFRRFVDGGQE